MTLTELRYIVTLAREKHFGRAAERCHVSQPTLSVAVRKLEDELGIEIFERSKNQVRVTDTGERIVQQAQRVLDQASLIRDVAQSGKNQLNEPLRLGAIYTVGPYLFPHMLPELHRAAPSMPLHIEESYTATLREKLRQAELDAIIVALPFNEPEVLTRPLYDEPFVVVLPRGHVLAKQSHIRSDQLLDDNLLLLGPGHCFRDQVLEACPDVMRNLRNPSGGRNGQPSVMTEGSSLETIRHMVASGLGITVLPLSAASSVHYSEPLLELRPFAGQAPMRTIALAWRVTFPRPKAIDVVTLAAGQCRVVPNDALVSALPVSA